MAALNPSQRYAMGMSYVPDSSATYGTVPVPKRTGGVLIPSAPVFENYSNEFVEEFQKNQQYYPVQNESDSGSNGIPMGVWIAIAAAGGLILYYAIK